MPDPAGISCVIPVFNEAACVASTLRAVEPALQAAGRPFEIIVADDGSTDGSAEAASASGIAHAMVRHAANRGYGAAIKSGVRRAKHPWILIIDADGTYPPEMIPKLAAAIDGGADMAVGRRTQTLATDSGPRLAGKAILKALAEYLAGRSIPDLNSGLRIMRRSDMIRFWHLLPEGFSLTTTMTLAVLCSGGTVEYIPIEYKRREGESKIRPARDMTGFIILMLRTMTYFNPMKVFVPLGAALITAAIATVVVSKAISGQVMDVTSDFLFMAGLQTLMLGVLADLMLKAMGMRNTPPDE